MAGGVARSPEHLPVDARDREPLAVAQEVIRAVLGPRPAARAGRLRGDPLRLRVRDPPARRIVDGPARRQQRAFAVDTGLLAFVQQEPGAARTAQCGRGAEVVRMRVRRDDPGDVLDSAPERGEQRAQGRAPLCGLPAGIDHGDRTPGAVPVGTDVDDAQGVGEVAAGHRHRERPQLRIDLFGIRHSPVGRRPELRLAQCLHAPERRAPPAAVRIGSRTGPSRIAVRLSKVSGRLVA